MVQMALCPVGATPLYGLHRYVRPKRVWFFSRFAHKQGIDLGYFGLKYGMVFAL